MAPHTMDDPCSILHLPNMYDHTTVAISCIDRTSINLHQLLTYPAYHH